MKISIGHKLFAASLVFVMAMAAFVAGSWASLTHLRALQDDGMTQVRAANLAQQLSGQGAALYQVIADAEINHQLDQTAADWAKAKTEADALFRQLRGQLTDPAQIARLDKAQAAYTEYTGAFDNQMLPALKATSELTADIRHMDDGIDEKRAAMTAPLLELSNAGTQAAIQADKDFDKLSGQILAIGTLIGVLGLVAGTAINLIAVRHISVPLKTLSGLLHRLIDGQAVASVPHEGRQDEVGDIARAVSAFKANLADVARLETEQAEARVRMERDNAKALQILKSAEGFEHQIKAVAARVGNTARDLNQAATRLDAAAREADERSNSMAAVTSQSSGNMQTVASATEELSASIAEIGRQVGDTTLMTLAATEQAERTGATVDNLSKAAARIGDVVALIQDIAGQTNLLALNATIEAARAGAAGAGFAVVAGEVKNLSAQTSRATSEIRDHIKTMQDVTQETVEAIRSISETIERINGVATAIAAGVTEQTAATSNIASNIAQVATGAQDINTDLIHVAKASQTTSETSRSVLDGAGSLSEQVDAMSAEVNAFLSLIRVAA
jgi:methyl-accepting chemotaxis protein